MSNLSFIFLYDSWLNSHRKGECNIFYADKPAYETNGKFVGFSQTARKLLYQKIGLPELTNIELGEAAIRCAKSSVPPSNEV